MQDTKSSMALNLAEEILSNIELSSVSLANVCLKATKLARLLNETQRQEFWMQTATFVGAAESEIETLKIQLGVAKDPDVSLSSANPNQHLIGPVGNAYERNALSQKITHQQIELNRYKSSIYYYVLQISSVYFDTIRIETDKKLAALLPDTAKQFISVYDNLKSQNSEDWSNAVHSCRRILKAVTDKLYPVISGKECIDSISGKQIRIGPDNYINRLMLYIENKIKSETSRDIFISNLNFWGNRIDAIFEASCKGTHGVLKSKSEAEKYVIHTYLLLSDILDL
jgi:hypothetical protein